MSTARAYELLADRATVGLDERENAELDALLAAAPELDAESWELAAAAIDLAWTEIDEPLPAALRQRVVQQASQGARVLAFTAPSPPAAAPARRDRLPAWSGWLAAAAVLVLAVLGAVPEIATSTPTPAKLRARLAAADGHLEIVWAPGGDPVGEGVSGDVVWSNARQQGFLRFEGLEVNDPTVWQYQLWIFDTAQSAATPIDGGVFDVTAEGEVVVAIDPKLRVVEPTLFAVTIEKPGGVVVSSRERLVVLASVSV